MCHPHPADFFADQGSASMPAGGGWNSLHLRLREGLLFAFVLVDRVWLLLVALFAGFWTIDLLSLSTWNITITPWPVSVESGVKWMSATPSNRFVIRWVFRILDCLPV